MLLRNTRKPELTGLAQPQGGSLGFLSQALPSEKYPKMRVSVAFGKDHNHAVFFHKTPKTLQKYSRDFGFEEGEKKKLKCKRKTFWEFLKTAVSSTLPIKYSENQLFKSQVQTDIAAQQVQPRLVSQTGVPNRC